MKSLRQKFREVKYQFHSKITLLLIDLTKLICVAAILSGFFFTLHKNFVKATHLCTKEITSLFDEKNLVGVDFSFFSSNQLLTKFLLIFVNKQWGAVRVIFFRNFYNVHTTQCGNCNNSLSHCFRKTFVKAMVLIKKLLKSWLNEIFFQWRDNF